MTISESTSVPTTMKAEVIDHFGPPDVMHSAFIAVPRLDDDEVLIRVETAGVGVWDPELCAGEFDTGGGFPQVLGSDGAGTVVAVGSRVTRFRAGDRVYAWGFLNPKGGFYAEYAALAQDEVAHVPAAISSREAGALAIDGLTALAGLDVLETGAGRTLMIVGASGGVGHLALQLAKRQGARVFAVASGADGVALARRLGADASADGRAADIVAMQHEFAPLGFDGALLLTGARADEFIGLVRTGGRVAYPNGVEPEPEPRSGIVFQSYDGYHGRDALERLNALVEAAPFHVEVSRTYSLDEAPQALRDAGKHHLGKLAVEIH
jgi:NADPH:quinone reductase-like Zn-dependent oxidoreductase